MPPGSEMCWRLVTTRSLLGRRSRTRRCVEQRSQNSSGANKEGRHGPKCRPPARFWDQWPQGSCQIGRRSAWLLLRVNGTPRPVGR